jgi:lipoate---protein ligase
MEEWEVVDTGVASAAANMRLDAQLLEDMHQSGRALLHFYDWEQESATYGYFLKVADYLNLEGVEKRRLSLARRPTGGGIVFHVWDFAFSVLVPATHRAFSSNALDNYAFVNRAVLQSVGHLVKPGGSLTLTPSDLVALDRPSSRFCMAQPTKYDVLLGGRKIAGAAQRKTKLGFLHQGTIALVMPPKDYLEDVLLPGTQVSEAMQIYTQPLLEPSATPAEMEEMKHSLRTLLLKYLKEQQ